MVEPMNESLTDSEHRIEVRGVVRRGEFSRRFDITIRHPRTAVVGTNGVGKTTLLRLIAGLERLRSGEVVIEGKTLDDSKTTFVAAHKRGVALAFDDQRLFSHLRVLDNVAYPLRRLGVNRVAAREQASEVLQDVGLLSKVGARPAELSSGQRQRVAIARAIATPAKVLLLDEPLASVDETSRHSLRELFLRTNHPTVVWVTHDPFDARFADTTIRLEP